MSIEDAINNLLRRDDIDTWVECGPTGKLRWSKEGKLQQECKLLYCDDDGIPTEDKFEWRDVPFECAS